jgi:hypothetical protein
MNPNFYVAEEVARQRVEEVARRAQEPWRQSYRPRPSMGAWASMLFMGVVLVSCSLLWLWV